MLFKTGLCLTRSELLNDLWRVSLPDAAAARRIADHDAAQRERVRSLREALEMLRDAVDKAQAALDATEEVA